MNLNKNFLKAFTWTIDDLAKATYTIPAFQRTYTWDKIKVIEFLNTLFKGFLSKDEVFLGTLYFKSNTRTPSLISNEIIDGQQRITTISLLYMALLYLYSNGYCNYENEMVDDIKKVLWKKIEGSIVKNLTMKLIDEQTFNNLFEKVYLEPKELFLYCKNMKNKGNKIGSKFADIIITMICKLGELFKEYSLIDFVKYLDSNVNFIVGQFNCNYNKMFEIFTQLNSMGLNLGHIELIISFILANIEDNYINDYLLKFEELVIKTEYRLSEYFNNYIKAFIHYYDNDIQFNDFKQLIEQLKLYYNTKTLSKTFCKMLDDMLECVNVYMSTSDTTYDIVKNSKFRYYYLAFCLSPYKHHRAVILRLLVDFQRGKIKKENLVKIIENIFKFMFEHFTICGRHSRGIVPYIKSVMKSAYENGTLEIDNVNSIIVKGKLDLTLNTIALKAMLKTKDCYSGAKFACKIILSLYDATEFNRCKYISYDKAYCILKDYFNIKSIDHLLVQNPDKNDEFMYYAETIENKKVLRLKEGHDFGPEIYDGMAYDEFSKKILNQIGNLKIQYKDKNSYRKNNVYIDQTYGKIIKYEQVKKRSDDIINIVIDYI